MIRRRPDQGQRSREEALRRALTLAVEPVEPAPDGLDRIRAKIAAGPQPAGGAPERARRPTAGRVRLALRAVGTRFRPEPARPGLLGWLRPATAVATGIFVMAAASWAVAALPQAVSPHQSTQTVSPRPTARASHRSVLPSYPYGGGYPTTAPSAAASCSPAPVPSGSPSPSPSGTPSPSPSASASPSPSQSGTPGPTTSPSAGPTGSDVTPGQSAARAAEIRPRTMPSPGGVPQIATPAPAPSPSTSPPASSPAPAPSGSRAPSPCGSAAPSPEPSPVPSGSP